MDRKHRVSRVRDTAWSVSVTTPDGAMENTVLVRLPGRVVEDLARRAVTNKRGRAVQGGLVATRA